jgi:hypothetical protein
MIERILIYIKHNLRFVWRIIDRLNAWFFHILYRSRMERVLPDVFSEFTKPSYLYRKLIPGDTEALFDLIDRQDKSDLKYFKPHDFDMTSIRRQFMNHAFLMMGVFDGDKLTGYFFLRFFANKKCFVGRLIDVDYRGMGIGGVMNNIMYETAWRMGFRCLSTISRHNTAVMKAHAKNQTMVVLKDLQNDYLLVEFMREAQGSGLRAQGKAVSDEF